MNRHVLASVLIASAILVPLGCVSRQQPAAVEPQGTAAAATPTGSSDKAFGVVWGTARSEVDRSTRRVTLESVSRTRSNFPTRPDNGASYLSELQQQLPGAGGGVAASAVGASPIASRAAGSATASARVVAASEDFAAAVASAAEACRGGDGIHGCQA